MGSTIQRHSPSPLDPPSSPSTASLGRALARRVRVIAPIACAASGVACRTGGVDHEQNCVLVAVEPHLEHRHDVAAGRPLLPQLGAAAAPEPGAARAQGALPGLAVHEGDHQHLAAGALLDHRGQQAVGAEAGLCAHRRTSTPAAARWSFTTGMGKGSKWKIDAASAASAPPSTSAARTCSGSPAPPLAITGTGTAVAIARVSSRFAV